MGTRADFWVGHGPQAEWLGSVAWDGYQWHEQPECSLMVAANALDFRAAVTSILAGRKDATVPSAGWPWPWNTSATTDYAYVFDDGDTHVYTFGSPAVADDAEEQPERTDWRDMSAVQNVNLGERSGLVIVSAKSAA